MEEDQFFCTGIDHYYHDDTCYLNSASMDTAYIYFDTTYQHHERDCRSKMMACFLQSALCSFMNESVSFQRDGLMNVYGWDLSTTDTSQDMMTRPCMG